MKPDRSTGGAALPLRPPTIERIDLLLGLYARLLPGSRHRPELLAHCDQLLDQRNRLSQRAPGRADFPVRPAG